MYRRSPRVSSPLVVHSEENRFHGSVFEHSAEGHVKNVLIR